MSERRILHQFLAGAVAGDAITDHAFTIQSWLRETGYASNIYAWHIDAKVRDQVEPLTSYRHHAAGQTAIYHHSTGSEAADFLQKHALKLILVYHNITPLHFVENIDPALRHALERGQSQLMALKPQIVLALGVSDLNARELQAMGFAHPGILPIALDEAAYDLPDEPETVAQLSTSKPLLLFVGRFAPNKKQEDLIKLLAYFGRIRPNAHLALVGDPWSVGYDRWVRDMAIMLGVSHNLIMPGKVTQQQLVTYYRHADVYVSMSEHEGFGKPLIESMLLGLPVMAFASTGVADTVSNAGILFKAKDFGRIAAGINVLLQDTHLKQQLQTTGRNHAARFLASNVKATFQQLLAQVNTT
jgi:glycosyltransferase involved in cell wall biosynthesis